MEREKAARGFLMTAQVLVFGIFGVDKFARSSVWIGWMPPWLSDLSGISRETWLMITGGIEILLAAALLFPKRIVRKIAAWGMVMHLVFVLTQTGINDLFVRDLGLLLSAVALAMLL